METSKHARIMERQISKDKIVINELLAALKLSYEKAAKVGYLNAGLSTDELITIEKAIKKADPDYKAPKI